MKKKILRFPVGSISPTNCLKDTDEAKYPLNVVDRCSTQHWYKVNKTEINWKLTKWNVALTIIGDAAFDHGVKFKTFCCSLNKLYIRQLIISNCIIYLVFILQKISFDNTSGVTPFSAIEINYSSIVN